MPIQVLPPALASQIAAGEVIERPASVVKELVENALDALPSRITVEVAGGGLRLIRVADDGAGIPADQVAVAFQRHATSKLTSVDDLYRIATLGFRGEALPSIAAVAQVTMLTRPAAAIAGTFVSLPAGEVVEQTTRACPAGTTVTVRQLFANVPARLKFLRAATTEVGHISHLLCQFALAYPEVSFTLVAEGRSALQTTGRGDRRETLVRVFGVEVARALLALGPTDATPAVSGFVSPPAVTRGTRQHLSFFVNRRAVQSRALARAVEDAYEGLLMVGRHPIVVLDLTVPPDELDVNVHPAKREVKFQQEHAVYSAVQRAVRQALLAVSPATSFTGRPAVADQERPSAVPAEGFAFNWPDEAAAGAGRPALTAAPGATSAGSPAPEGAAAAGRLPILRVVGQVGGTYVIAEGPAGMYLIDQHAAHERILYERLLAQSGARAVEVQGLLDPLTVEVLPAQAAVLDGSLPAFADLGFVVEPFGERACLVRAVPAVLRGANLQEAFAQVAEALTSEDGQGDWRERACLTLACHSAIRAGQTLSMEEMRELVRQLERTVTPHSCPHGRPILILLSAAQLEKEFGRR